LIAIAIVTGCSFHAGGSSSGDDAPRSDVLVDTPPGQVCFGTSPSSLFTMCYPPAQVPAAAFSVGASRSINTTACNNGVVATSHGVEACVFAGSTITISSNVVATGTRPLVFVAVGDLTVALGGTLDVSSNRNRVGANGDATTCNPAGAGMNATSGGGGGAGGSFATAGGSGGGGGAVGTTAGTAVASATPLSLRGGCRGGTGGDGNGNAGGAGGHSGGAIYLIAGGTISIAGKVYASGAGGLGGDATAGGGGGGTGGLIGFDATVVAINPSVADPQAVIATNGGGGGGGGDGSNNGGDGGDGTLVSTPGASGGTGGMSPRAGDGGVGTNWSNLTGGNGQEGAAGTGGGGGGGGYGAIWVVGTWSAGNGDISPQQPLVH
jgi:hypothetical protein